MDPDTFISINSLLILIPYKLLNDPWNLHLCRREFLTIFDQDLVGADDLWITMAHCWNNFHYFQFTAGQHWTNTETHLKTLYDLWKSSGIYQAGADV